MISYPLELVGLDSSPTEAHIVDDDSLSNLRHVFRRCGDLELHY